MKINNTLWPVALLLCVLLCGCGTMRVKNTFDPNAKALGAPFPYPSVVWDIAIVGGAFTGSTPPLKAPLYLLDLPVAVVVDTLYLPFDIVSAVRQRSEPERQRRRYLATRTPVGHLFDAIRDRNASDVLALLAQGVDANATNSSGTSALSFSVLYAPDEGIAKCLLDHGANDPLALHYSVLGSNLSVVKCLVDHGWDPLKTQAISTGSPFETALDVAARARQANHSSEAIVEYLRRLEKERPNQASQDTSLRADPQH